MARDRFQSGNESGNESVIDKHGHRGCEVYGCERKGHIYTFNWNCRYHHGAVGDKLAHITTILRNHEPEINWYELLLYSTEVDWECGDLKARVVRGLEPKEGEKFKPYRERVEEYIHKLIGKNKVVIDHKMQASADDGFKHVASLIGEF